VLAKFSARVSQAAVPSGRALRKLDAALTGLPTPWRVLRNRRARAADGPPWTKYMALHPAKGIALIDLFPANPHAAIAPLDEFLARTGFLAFSRGDPPIVAIALTERDVGDFANCLSNGFATAQPCGIQNPNWADAVVDLLVSTPGLLLTPLDRKSNRAMPSDGHRAPRHDAPQTPHFRVEPAAAQSGAECKQRTSRLPLEPQQKAAEPTSPESRLAVAADPDLRLDRLSSLEHRRRWRVMTPWILGVSAAAVMFVISFTYWHKELSGPEGPPENAAQQTVEIPSAPPVESLLPPTSPAPETPNVAPPKVSTPQPKVASTEPPAKTFMPPPPRTFMPPSKRDAGSSNDAAATASHAVANHAPTVASAERGENVHAQLSLKPPRSTDVHPPETALPESPQNEETITIDGVTYVQGRQPHALGLLSEPQSTTSELIPNRDGDGDGVLIQPLQ
jgi:hypothetical protein